MSNVQTIFESAFEEFYAAAKTHPTATPALLASLKVQVPIASECEIQLALNTLRDMIAFTDPLAIKWWKIKDQGDENQTKQSGEALLTELRDRFPGYSESTYVSALGKAIYDWK
ncbi:MAG TPA: hypothetical protein VHM90_19510 [Phycisphaerae bacterium]|nr:hypothetical protein [Phycisphaerae bacterium]